MKGRGGTGARAPLMFSNCWAEQARPGQFTAAVIFAISTYNK